MHEDIQFMLIGTEVPVDDYEKSLNKFLSKYNYELFEDKIFDKNFIFEDDWWNNYLAVIKKEKSIRVFLEDGEVFEESIIIISDIILNNKIL